MKKVIETDTYIPITHPIALEIQTKLIREGGEILSKISEDKMPNLADYSTKFRTTSWK